MQLTHQHQVFAHQQHESRHNELIHQHLTKLVTFTIPKNFMLSSQCMQDVHFCNFLNSIQKYGVQDELAHQYHELAHQYHELADQHHKLAHHYKTEFTKLQVPFASSLSYHLLLLLQQQ